MNYLLLNKDEQILLFRSKRNAFEKVELLGSKKKGQL